MCKIVGTRAAFSPASGPCTVPINRRDTAVTIAAMTMAARPTPKPSAKPGRSDPAERPSAGERLSKCVMRLASCSRREAEQYIEGGWVRVDGVVVEIPMRRITQQQVQLDPQARLGGATAVTILLHRSAPTHTQGKTPATRSPNASTGGLIRVQNHWPQDPSPTPVLQRHLSGLQTSESLEANASGLWVFTQDWRIQRKLTEDAALIEHEWLVEVSGPIEPGVLLQLAHASQPLGIPFKVSISSTHAAGTVLRWAVKGSHPGMLASLCAQHRLQVLSMKLQRLGRVGLAGLPAGMWRYLLPQERF